MSREEHLQWCKQRALEYVELGQYANALASIGSDLDKEEETGDHPGVKLGLGLMIIGKLTTKEEMRRFINGFH